MSDLKLSREKHFSHFICLVLIISLIISTLLTPMWGSLPDNLITNIFFHTWCFVYTSLMVTLLLLSSEEIRQQK